MSDGGDITIRVGASVDRSVSTVFAQMRDTAKQAHKAIADSADAADEQMRRGYRDNAKVFDGAAKEEVETAKKSSKERLRNAEQEEREMERLRRWGAQQTRQHLREIEAEEKRSRRTRDNANKRQMQQHQREVRQNWGAPQASRIAHGAARGAAHFGMSLLRDLAGGAGVNLSLGEHMRANTELESTLTTVSNEGYMPNDPRNARRVGVDELTKESFKIGNATGTSANEIGEGFKEFVGNTGDLQTARDVMADLAKIAKATGSTFQDVVGAAAKINNQLDESPEKAKAISNVMRMIAAEGKVGAIPMRDMAAQMSKIAANASRMEGDAGRNIALFGAIAQSAALKGGASGAANATTSIGSMMNTFRSAKRVAEFKARGVDINSKTDPTKMRNIEDIIVDSFKATQKKTFSESQAALSDLFKTSQAAKAVGGFQSIFSNTYGHSKATTEQGKLEEAAQAVRKEFDRLSQTMSDEELNASFGAAMKTSASQAATFNNAMQDMTQSIQTALLPVLQEMAPDLVKLSKSIKEFFGGGSAKGNDAATDAVHANADIFAGGAALTDKTIDKTVRDKAKKDEKLLRASIAAHKAELATQKTEGISTGERMLGVGAGAVAGVWDHFKKNMTGKNGAKGVIGQIFAPTALLNAAEGAYGGGKEVHDMQNESFKNRLGTSESQLAREQGSLDQLTELNKKIDSAITGGTMKVAIIRDDTKRGGPRAGESDSDSMAPTE